MSPAGGQSGSADASQPSSTALRTQEVLPVPTCPKTMPLLKKSRHFQSNPPAWKLHRPVTATAGSAARALLPARELAPRGLKSDVASESARILPPCTHSDTALQNTNG